MLGNRKVLAVITARGGSKGVPGKNIAALAGRPLIEWTVRAASQSRYIDRIILSSDDARIIAVAVDLGCDVPFVRSEALANDTALSMDVVLDAVDRVSGYDVVVLLQPTSPLRTGEDIDGTLALLEAAPAAVSVTEASIHPWLTYRPGADGALSPYVALSAEASMRRQDLPPAVELNGAVYAADIAWLRRERSFLTGQTRAWRMPPERSIDIDTALDFQIAERIVGQTSDNNIDDHQAGARIS